MLNDRPIGTKRLTEAVDGVLTWTVPYEPGVLKAVGLKDGKPACEFALHTAGPASRVELLPDIPQIAADGKDVCHVEYRIVDTNGVRVPDATQAVTFEVVGPAKIIGIGNADGPDTCRRQIKDDRAAEPARSHHQYLGGPDFGLAGTADLPEHDVPGITLQISLGKAHGFGLTAFHARYECVFCATI